MSDRIRPFPAATMRALVLCLLAACGGSEEAAPDAAPQRVFGGDRPVELQVPDLTPGTTYPLVMILHGHTGTGLIQQVLLELADLKDEGVFVIAPDGTVNSVDGHTYWNAESACCNHGDHSVDDVAYLGGILDDVMASWPIDPGRVFVLGHSNGAFMSYRMACERADVIAAIAPLAGMSTMIDGVDDCDPSRPVSVLHIHGTADATIPYAGGDFGDGVFVGAAESTAQWAAHDGCAATFTDGDPIDLEQDLEGPETTTADADGCPSGVGVSRWSIEGGSHIPDVQPTFGHDVLTWLLDHAR